MKQVLFFLLVFVSYNLWAQDFVKIENINGKKYYLYLTHVKAVSIDGQLQT